MSALRHVFALALLILLAPRAGAQSGNPQGSALTMRLPAGASYHEGELIPFTFTFRPGSGHFSFAGFLVDPALDCGSLARPCHITDMRTFSKSDPMLLLNFTAEPIERGSDLNVYVPRLKPGRYRVALLTRVMVFQGTELEGSWRFAEPPAYLVSNQVAFEIVPATLPWIRQTIAEANTVLETRDVDYQKAQTAARRLRFLQHPLAWKAALAHLGNSPSSNDLLFGMWESSRPAEVCALMRARLADPAQYVSYYYLDYLADICRRARPDYDARKWNAEVAAQRAALLGEAAGFLAENLGSHTGAAKGAAIYSLLQYVENVRNNFGYSGHPPALPAWLPQLRREAARTYFDLPPYLRNGLLDSPVLRGPETTALLDRILAAKVTDYNDVQNWNSALRRLYVVDAERGRARMLAELRNPDTRIEESTLALLPPESVPPMDNELIETLAAARRHPAGNPRIVAWMIARYASPRVLDRLKAIFEEPQNSCQPELMAYFLRTDPAYADAVFHRHPWNMQAEAPCALEYFTVTARTYLHPALEKYLTAYLMHNDVRLKMAAAESLRQYGSPAAREPLWAAYRYFHNYWKDRRQEMGATQANEMLETALRGALARARNWLANETELRLLESLCLNRRCLWESHTDLEAWRKPIRVDVWFQEADGFRASVAQYTVLNSPRQLLEKLAQFPAGTPFHLSFAPKDTNPAGELRREAAARGILWVE